MKLEINIDDRLVASAKRVFSRRNLVAVCMLGLLGSVAVYAAPLTVPNEFKGGEVISADAVNANFLALAEAGVPVGGIVMWSGTIASIPTGWQLCDGTNGAPDLRDRFIVGARQDDVGLAKTNIKGSLMQTGGQSEHTLTTAEMPAHSHGVQEYDGGSNVRRRFVWEGLGQANANDGWDTQNPTTNTGGGAAHENTPPFFALALIIRTEPI